MGVYTLGSQVQKTQGFCVQFSQLDLLVSVQKFAPTLSHCAPLAIRHIQVVVIVTLLLKFQEQNVTDSVVSKLSTNRSKNEKVIQALRERIVCMAFRLNGFKLNTETTA